MGQAWISKDASHPAGTTVGFRWETRAGNGFRMAPERHDADVHELGCPQADTTWGELWNTPFCFRPCIPKDLTVEHDLKSKIDSGNPLASFQLCV